ncbi:DsbC family protein [Gammaproteobacteria bacterium]|nr:DsbC family protein [Gammaproteobacteria bacterium]
MINPLIFTLGVVALLTSTVVMADPVKDVADARSRVEATLEDLEIEAFAATDHKDLYEMTFQGQDFMVLVNEELVVIGEVFLQGDSLSLNLLQERTRVSEVLNGLSQDRFISFGDQSLPHHVTVFTDVTCPYCKIMHKDVEALNEAGIRVQYLLYPRDRPGSDIWVANESVWCSEDQGAAMTAAKRDESVDVTSCDNTLQETFEAGQRVGLKGTPMIILENGQSVPEGYLPAEPLIQRVLSSESTDASS